jgi:hypothetical protein
MMARSGTIYFDVAVEAHPRFQFLGSLDEVFPSKAPKRQSE